MWEKNFSPYSATLCADYNGLYFGYEALVTNALVGDYFIHARTVGTQQYFPYQIRFFDPAHPRFPYGFDVLPDH